MRPKNLTSAKGPLDREETNSCNKNKESNSHLVSFISEIPAPIQTAMTTFIECHPNWDQYRLLQAALAGFLVQNGISSRLITRLYIGNMFGSHLL